MWRSTSVMTDDSSIQPSAFSSQRYPYYDRPVIPAVVLAAGKSTRMGRPKATLPLGGAETFLTRIVRTLYEAEVEDVVVVLGHDADAIVESLTRTGLPPRLVINRHYETGQWAPVLAGLRAIDPPRVHTIR